MRLLTTSLMCLGVGGATAFQQTARWGRADLAEVCCTSDSVLSEAVLEKGGRVLRYSHWNGFDLSTKRGLHACLQSLRTERPRYTWFSPPCTAGSKLNYLNDSRHADSPEYQVRRKDRATRNLRIWKNVATIYEAALHENFTIPLIEQPKDNLSWKGPFQKLLKDSFATETHGCAWGMRDPDSGLLIRKAWRIMHPEQELDRQLQGHVCSHDHPHQELLGGVKVAQSARYPKRMAQWLAGYFLRPEEPADVNCASQLYIPAMEFGFM